nr:hypothetical protein [Desulfurococcales archaeon]
VSFWFSVHVEPNALALYIASKLSLEVANVESYVAYSILLTSIQYLTLAIEKRGATRGSGG